MSKHPAIGQYCIIRTYASGTHAGVIADVQSNEGRSRAVVKDARRLWKWVGGLSLSEISQFGVRNGSRISCVVPVHYLEDCIEFLPATDAARESIEHYPADTVGR